VRGAPWEMGSRQSSLYRSSDAFPSLHAAPDTPSHVFLDVCGLALTPRHCHPKGLALTPVRTAPHCRARVQVVVMRSVRLERADHAQRGMPSVPVVLVDPGRTPAAGPQRRGHHGAALVERVRRPPRRRRLPGRRPALDVAIVRAVAWGQIVAGHDDRLPVVTVAGVPLTSPVDGGAASPATVLRVDATIIPPRKPDHPNAIARRRRGLPL
jgi:hypothetical protein